MLLWLTVALGLVTVTHSVPGSLDCFPVPYFYSERPLINSGLQAGKAYLHDSDDPHETLSQVSLLHGPRSPLSLT